MATPDTALSQGTMGDAPPEGRVYFPTGGIVDVVTAPIFGRTPPWWWIGFLVSSVLLVLWLATIGVIVAQGPGVWDVNNPVFWGTGIINLVFWIGIGHAGTFISAFLLLMRQHWRGSFSRFAEASTLFALATAGLFPILHTGRPWFAYWVGPYPNQLGLNPQWTSALPWDLVAISTYGIVSLLFFSIDLLPDLAAMRDRSESRAAKFFYGTLAAGWRGDSAHWERLRTVSFSLAALATPLVISVHSIIGLDFAISNVPGWHHTIFPPYFVAGAVLSGFAMVAIIAIVLRNKFNMQNLITLRHMDYAARLILVTSLLVGYGYLMEVFGAWYGGHIGEVLLVTERMLGPYAGSFWLMVFGNVIVTQLLWFRSVRRNQTLLVIISLLVLVGMWMERFVLITVSLGYNHSVSMWEQWHPTFVDLLTIIGPFGLFFTALFLFVRFFPTLPMFEVQEINDEEGWE